jgi:hypothetical protein
MAFDPYAPNAIMRLDRAGGRPVDRSPIAELAVRLARPESEGGQGLTIREAAAAAKAAAKRFAPEHPAWAHALEEWPGSASKRVVDALAEVEAVEKWVNANVHGFGGRGRRVTDELLDEAIRRREAAGDRLSDAVAELTAAQRGS